MTEKTSTTKNIPLLLACIIGCIVVGSLPSYASITALQNWFPTLIKPRWNPPAYLFGPVWTILFTMMGIALWQILLTKHILRQKALLWFGIQFGLNLCWTIIFFAMQNPGGALIEIILLWSAILYTTIQFYAIRKSAGVLMIPYICWVSFATVLNCSIWWLNK